MGIISVIMDVFGIVGVTLLIWSYYLVGSGKLSPLTFYYQLCNLIGAVLILISLMFHWNLASFVLELIWAIVGLNGLRVVWRLNSK